MRKTMLGLLLVVLVMAGTISLSGCWEDKPYPPTIRKLDAHGNVWYIQDGDQYDPTKYISRTCASVGKEVDQVILAGKYAAEATIRCKD